MSLSESCDGNTLNTIRRRQSILSLTERCVTSHYLLENGTEWSFFKTLFRHFFLTTYVMLAVHSVALSCPTWKEPASLWAYLVHLHWYAFDHGQVRGLKPRLLLTICYFTAEIPVPSYLCGEVICTIIMSAPTTESEWQCVHQVRVSVFRQKRPHHGEAYIGCLICEPS